MAARLDNGQATLVSILPARGAEPCGDFRDKQGSCLVLSMRQLGDAVISSGLINSILRQNSRLAVDVLGRPGLEEVIRTFTSPREYIGIELPLYGHHRRNMASILGAVRTLRMIRRRKYDFCLNLIGDTRENAIGSLVGAKWNIAPVWESGHLFKHKMTDRGASRLTNCGVSIPARYPNFYDSMEYFAVRLGLPGLQWHRRSSRREAWNERLTVALHSGASHPSRHWSGDKWRALIRELRLRGHSIKMLGAPDERVRLLATYSNEIEEDSLQVITEPLAGFVSALAEADVLIGMDSFSVHAAYALGVPVIVLNGSADPSILKPPGGEATSAGHLCNQFPCYYGYPCRGSKSEYICVRGIEVGAVMDAFDRIVNTRFP